VPARALGVAQALGVLPDEVFIVGCEPAEVDELTTALTPAVAAAVDAAITRIDELLGADRTAGHSVEADPVAALRRRDEILQIMFWLQAEGLGPEVTPGDVLRFLDDGAAVDATLRQLVDDGFAEAVRHAAGAHYRLTAFGVQEGRRRFMDEFEPYLARNGHGECGAADCDCRVGGECRAAG
jgi:hypothetical protein